MKIRTGFVSNSSSSSFVCWGVPLEEVNISDKRWLEVYEDLKKWKKEYVDKHEGKKLEYSWEKNSLEESRRILIEMERHISDEEKIEYAKERYEDNLDEVIDSGEMEIGGQEYSKYVGMTVEQLEKRYPELKFSEVRNFVAKKLNEQFGSKYTEEDIKYTEQGWYNG